MTRSRTNAEWLRDLKATGDAQASALAELRGYLVRAARFALGRSRLGHDRSGTYNAGHPGVAEPHYHIAVWYVSRDQVAQLK